jgi:uncharacterized BrkB/YihY/UPF0761 family membrane protein
MDIATLATWKFVIVVALATVIAMIIHLYDPPESKPKVLADWVLAALVTIIAAFLAGWMALESGTDIYGFFGFIMVAGSALGGIAFVRVVLSKTLTPPSSPGPPPA